MGSRWTFRNLLSESNGAIFVSGPTSAAATTFALSASYTYATSGRAYVGVIVASESANLTDLWVRVSSYSGTWGSTDGVINFEIREGLNGSRIPGTSLTGSGTITLDGSTTGWIHKSGLSIALTAGKLYCVVIYDNDGGGTNFVTMVAGTNSAASALDSAVEFGTTTSGFSSAYSQTGGTASIGVKIGSTVVVGGTFDSISTVTSGTYERGMRFQPQENCTLVGATIKTDTNLFATAASFNLYADATAPGGAKISSFTLPSFATGFPLPAAIITPSSNFADLIAGTWYRYVFSPAAAITVPRKATISGSPDSSILSAAIPMGGNCYWTANNSGSWLDDPNSMCLFGPILVPSTASGGGTNRRNIPS